MGVEGKEEGGEEGEDGVRKEEVITEEEVELTRVSLGMSGAR